MTNQALTTTKPNSLTSQQASAQAYAKVTQLVTDSLTSEVSRVMYKNALDDFFSWYDDSGRPTLSKAVVNAYKVALQDKGYAPATINQRLSAIRKFATEASDNGLIPLQVAYSISSVKGVRSAGVRTGKWLNASQSQALLNAPDINTLKGVRDYAILAVLLDGGLRRSEVAKLEFSHIQQINGRWAIVDFIGKGNKVRTVPIRAWVKQAIDDWASQAGIDSGRIFRSINKGGNLSGNSMTSQAIQDVVKLYANQRGFDISAHDLRRTCAQSAKLNGCDNSQIQIMLGHSSPVTTDRYLGGIQDFANAPCDYLPYGGRTR